MQLLEREAAQYTWSTPHGGTGKWDRLAGIWEVENLENVNLGEWTTVGKILGSSVSVDHSRLGVGDKILKKSRHIGVDYTILEM